MSNFICYDRYPGPDRAPDGLPWSDPESDPIGDIKAMMEAIKLDEERKQIDLHWIRPSSDISDQTYQYIRDATRRGVVILPKTEDFVYGHNIV